jgi:hypothetical protein
MSPDGAISQPRSQTNNAKKHHDFARALQKVSTNGLEIFTREISAILRFIWWGAAGR